MRIRGRFAGLAIVVLSGCRCDELTAAPVDAGAGDAAVASPTDAGGDAGDAGPSGAVDEAQYTVILDRLYEALAVAMEEAQKRRFCTRDEWLIARHALTPAGFTGMQRILDDVGVTGLDVQAYVLGRGLVGPAEEVHAARHAAAMSELEQAVEATIAAAGPDCVADPPRCEEAFARFLAFHLEDVPTAERETKKAEIMRGMPGFLNDCRADKGAADFDCVITASDAREMEGCALANGLRLEWAPN